MVESFSNHSQQLSENFHIDEFRCPHCGEVEVDNNLIKTLQAFRDELGQPITFTSAYRCPEHNSAVGGAENSYHVKGQAVDIPLYTLKESPEELVELAFKVGFTGVGLNLEKGFIHVDVRSTDKPVRFYY